MSKAKNKKTARRRGGRRAPRDERLAHHQGLSNRTLQGLETLLWAQSQRYHRALRLGLPAVKPTKDSLYDTAIEEFLIRHKARPVTELPEVGPDHRNVMFWVLTSLSQRLGKIAARDKVPYARVLDAAAADFVNRHASTKLAEKLASLRAKVEDLATALLEGEGAAVPRKRGAGRLGP